MASKRKRKPGMATHEELLELNRLFFDALVREIAREKPRYTIVAIARDVLRDAGVLAEVTNKTRQAEALRSLGAAADDLTLPFSAVLGGKLKDR